MLQRLDPSRILIPGALALALAVAALAVAFMHPPGHGDANAAVRDHAEPLAAPENVEILTSRPWGDGRLVLAGYDSGEDQRTMWIGFVIDWGRGWRVAAATTEAVSGADVGVGSLLVTTSAGGSGQPPWTAVHGEIADGRINSIEVRWPDEDPTTVDRDGNAYLVVREGQHQPDEVLYLDSEGDTIATVPVNA